MFMLTHCVACAWWVLGRYERGEADQLADNSFLPPAEALNRPRRLQYLGALYWASLVRCPRRCIACSRTLN